MTADACKSTTGFVIMLGGAAVMWRSRLQRHVATSTGGAEYHAAYECGVEATSLAALLGEMGFTQGPIQIFDDSNVCISMTTSDTITAAHKALKTRYHWLRERAADGTIKLLKINTEDQRADHFTKPLGPRLFNDHTRFIMGEV